MEATNPGWRDYVIRHGVVTFDDDVLAATDRRTGCRSWPDTKGFVAESLAGICAGTGGRIFQGSPANVPADAAQQLGLALNLPVVADTSSENALLFFFTSLPESLYFYRYVRIHLIVLSRGPL